MYEEAEAFCSRNPETRFNEARQEEYSVSWTSNFILLIKYFLFSKNEIEQYRQVLGHQMFRQNPLGVLETHLTNTVKLQQKEASSKL